MSCWLISLAPIIYICLRVTAFLQSKGGTQLIRGILQLVEEWEYHFSLAGVAHHSVKAMLAKNIDGPSRDKTREVGDEGDKQQEQASANLRTIGMADIDYS